MARTPLITDDQKAQTLQIFVHVFGKPKPFNRSKERKPENMAYTAYEWLNCKVQLYFYEDGWIVCYVRAEKYAPMDFEGRSFKALKKALARFATREIALVERELTEKNKRRNQMMSLQNFANEN